MSSNFARWKGRVPKLTRELADMLEARIVPLIEKEGFRRVFLVLNEDPVRSSEIQFERSIDNYIDSITIFFAPHRDPRFQIGCARREGEPPYEFVRSCHFVARANQYLHFWGKPWWRPAWSWSLRDAQREIYRIEDRLPQLFEFIVKGVVGPNISRQTC